MLKERGIEIPFGVGGGACDKAFAERFELGIYGKDPSEALKMTELAVKGRGWKEIRSETHQ